MTIKEKQYSWATSLKHRISTKYIILHHRAGDGDVDSIHNAHIKKGWAGIGYHFYVRKNGDIYRGRPINAWGAQCIDHNADSVGVCFEGNFEKENMTQKQMNSGIELVKYLLKLYPSASIVGHRDLYSTVCPGKNFPMQTIKNEVFNMNKQLTSANDIIWELMNGKLRVPIDDVSGAVNALENAKNDSRYSSLYWILRKIANNITK